MIKTPITQEEDWEEDPEDPDIPTVRDMETLRSAIPDHAFLLLNTARLTHNGAVVEAQALVGKRIIRCLAVLAEADEEDVDWPLDDSG